MNTGICTHPDCNNPALVGKRGPKAYCSEACRVDMGRIKRGVKSKTPYKASRSSKTISKNKPLQCGQSERLAQFFVKVARELAKTHQALKNADDPDQAETAMRCLAWIGEFSERPDIQTYLPDQAQKMAMYSEAHIKKMGNA